MTMADAVYTGETDYFGLSNVGFTGVEGAAGSVLDWTGRASGNTDYTLTDVAADGLLVAGEDYWLNSTYLFTGYTITGTDSQEYPVFSNGGSYFVVTPEGSHGSGLIPASGSSNVYQSPEGDAFLCFGSGTKITTPSGICTVQDLTIGDLICTVDGSNVPVRWIGRQTVQKLRAGPKMQPVRIREGALGNGLPHSDLTVTADHGMIVDGLVINASALVNGHSIDWVAMAELPERVTYYHIETEAHDVILANGAPAETFVDIPGRMAFDNYAEYLELYGVERIIPEMDRPRIASRRLLPDATRVRLGIVDEKSHFDGLRSA